MPFSRIFRLDQLERHEERTIPVEIFRDDKRITMGSRIPFFPFQPSRTEWCFPFVRYLSRRAHTRVINCRQDLRTLIHQSNCSSFTDWKKLFHLTRKFPEFQTRKFGSMEISSVLQLPVTRLGIEEDTKKSPFQFPGAFHQTCSQHGNC